MLRELTRKLQALRVEPVVFDPATLDDEVALTTDWTPLRSGGASFQTHQLVLQRPNRISFRPTWGAIAFGLTFIVLGLIVITICLFVEEMSLGMRVLLMAIGLGFAGGMRVFLVFQFGPNLFDVNRGFYTKGWFDAGLVRLDEIHALQLISERCRGRNRTFYSYELNLVLEDGQRVNVVDHGDLAQLQADARTISQRLDVPVWDATG